MQGASGDFGVSLTLVVLPPLASPHYPFAGRRTWRGRTPDTGAGTVVVRNEDSRETGAQTTEKTNVVSDLHSNWHRLPHQLNEDPILAAVITEEMPFNSHHGARICKTVQHKFSGRQIYFQHPRVRQLSTTTHPLNHLNLLEQATC